MASNNISVIGKKLDIFFSKFDNPIKIGSVRLTEKDLKSENNFIEVLQKVTKGLDNGTYTLHHNDGLFARFDIKKKQVTKLHKWSENTGMIMPCWNHFKE